MSDQENAVPVAAPVAPAVVVPVAPVPWYKNLPVLVNGLSAVVTVLGASGLIAVPVVGQVGALVTFGLALYNVFTHHNSASGLAVAAAAAQAATEKLNAGAGQ